MANFKIINFKQSITFFVVACLFANSVASNKVPRGVESDASLLSFMAARTNDLVQRDAGHSTDCFNYYIPLIDEITKTYQRTHSSCLQASWNGRDEAKKATQHKRDSLGTAANYSCALLSQCSEIESADEVFECYVAGGLENTKNMYTINVNASGHLLDLQEEFRLIENKEYKCTNDTKLKYERDSTKAYEDFNKCILGLITPPVSTEAPVTTTSTANPETTESTENPEIPDAPSTAESTTLEDTVIPESRKASESHMKYAINRIPLIRKNFDQF